jgi:polyisoprenoid-binding protein YceI
MKLATLPLLFLFALLASAGQQPPDKIDPLKTDLVKKWKKLPPGWTKLKLTKAQTEQVYDVKKKAFLDYYPLQLKIDAIHTQELKDCVKLLTEEQKKKLVMID